MKGINLTWLLLLWLYINVCPQGEWISQNSGTTLQLNGVSFLTKDIGYIVGYGRILATTDGGNSWMVQRNNETLFAVSFVNTSTGWAVGLNGTILKTSNAGLTWEKQNSNVSEELYSVFFCNSQVGYAVGYKGKVLKTIDGGLNWEIMPRPSSTINYLWSVYFINQDVGWIIGNYNDFFKTTDGGKTWERKAWPSQYAFTPKSIFFIDSENGWIVGSNGTIASTTNGGLSWVPQVSGTNNKINSISFISKLTGWAVGGGGIILFTTNGGISWNRQNNPIAFPEELFSVQFIDENTGYAVGDRGQILKFQRPSISNITLQNNSNWNVGSNQNIFWSSVNVIGKVTISLSIDGGISFEEKLVSNLDNNGFASLLVPNKPSTKCRIKVELTNNPNISAINNSNFTIPSPSIVVSNPIIGSNWIIGNNQTINWTSQNVGGNVNILLSTNGGVSFPISLATNSINDGIKVVKTPDYISNRARVKVELANEVSVFGINSADFTISPKSIILVSPNGNEIWRENELNYIIWENSGVDNLKIDYTTNNGISWLNIADNISALSEKYEWKVPSTISKQCKVRISDLENPSVSDISDNFFTIDPITDLKNHSTLYSFCYLLYENYPNPFNPNTQISFDIPKQTYVELKVFNSLGKEITTLTSKEYGPGKYTFDFNAEGLASGVYFYTLKSYSFRQTKKMLLIK